MAITTDTKSLFVSLIRKFNCDLVLDIGSRDGKQAILFQDVLPQARVVAFEANPKNFQKMAADPSLDGRITLLPVAVSDTDGKAVFHIADADYNARETEGNNLGISSLLVHPGIKTSEHVEVETVRLDTFLSRPEYQRFQSIALWIDVESAEYFVIEGMRAVADRIKIVQTETAKTPMRIGQRTYDDVARLLESLGWTEVGSNIGNRDNWGDVVFVPKPLRSKIRGSQLKALIYNRIRINNIAVFLKNKSPFLYRTLRKMYVKAN